MTREPWLRQRTRMRMRLAMVGLLAGCPVVEEVGEKPEGTTTSDVEETSGSSSESSGGATDTDAPIDGPIDCAQVPMGGATVDGGPIGELGFPPPCSPRDSGVGEYKCCSDDPAAVGGNLPAYQFKGIDGTVPIFSGGNNPIGTSGLCVRTADIPPGSGLLEPQAENCPIPCNPTWDNESIAAVCSEGRVCCQTQLLQPEDCFLDGDTWRPVTGHDIGQGTDWGATVHATHQDPGGDGCRIFAPGSENPADNEALADCYAQLNVANQRGYCMALQPGQICPAAPETGFIDACMQINMGLIPPPQ